MQGNKSTPDELFWTASLNGQTCKAFAWVQATSLDVLDGQGHVRTVAGVRRWRGKALIDRDALPADLHGTATVRYAGKVKDGDHEREIDADVFLYFRQAFSEEDYAGGDGAVSRQTYVEFIGAERPFKTDS